jgi:hypothetical protein
MGVQRISKGRDLKTKLIGVFHLRPQARIPSRVNKKLQGKFRIRLDHSNKLTQEIK